MVRDAVRAQDMIVTTALIPGRKGPVLVSRDMVESMRPGSVIVDLAVENGGNCELSRYGEIVDHQGVKIIGHANVPARLAPASSALYARNLLNFTQLLIDKDTKQLSINLDDDLIRGTLITRDGEVVHPALVASQAA